MPTSPSASIAASASAKRSKKLRRVWWPDQQPGGEDDRDEGDGSAEAGFSVKTSKVGVRMGVPRLAPQINERGL